MECINFLWEWFGDNSGQVQILIAVIALILAYIVYRKVLEQIKISIDQTKESAIQSREAAEQTKISNQRSLLASEQRDLILEQNKLIISTRLFELKCGLLGSLTNTLVLINRLSDLLSELASSFDSVASDLRGQGDVEHLDIAQSAEGFRFLLSQLEEQRSIISQIAQNLKEDTNCLTIEVLESNLISVLSVIVALTKVESTMSGHFNYLKLLRTKIEKVSQLNELISPNKP